MIEWRKEWKPLVALTAVFLACFYLPVGAGRFNTALVEAFHLVKWYAREHVVFCLLPAFFIAGAVTVFLSQGAVMKYLGPGAKKVVAYGVAAVSGSILAVCSCTILPLFAGIHRMGAGLGPACAFLYAGPAINILAIILTARVLGPELGAARAIGAIVFSIVIGLSMQFIFRKEETAAPAAAMMPEQKVPRPLWQNAAFFAAMILILVFANWGKSEESGNFWLAIHGSKWWVVSLAALALGLILVSWFKFAWKSALAIAAATAVAAFLFPAQPMIAFVVGLLGFSLVTGSNRGELGEWFGASWTLGKQIMPLLFIGVLAAGFLLGRPEHEGLIPGKYIEMLVGASPDTFLTLTGLDGGAFEALIRSLWLIWTNLFASVAGAFMYFATLTEVPILEGLIASGMGKGPALALLLAGPALSLPNMLVIGGVLGAKKTIVFIILVIVMATFSGLIYGAL